ncbi:MAG: aldehyde dehydrogenase family protein, partial [Acidimicrobiales bacterium]
MSDPATPPPPVLPTAAQWRERARAITIDARAWIGGEAVDALSGATFADHSPRDGSRLADVASCDDRDVARAVESARRAFVSSHWSDAAPGERKRILRRFAELVAEHTEELALLETLDVGKPIGESLRVDVPAAAQCLEWFAETVDKQYGEIAPTGPDSLALVTREPVGVVGAVVPWNYPLIISAWKIAPALAAGNSVILKPAEQSPLSSLVLGRLATEAGIPDGVFNVVPGDGPRAGAALGRHPDV